MNILLESLVSRTGFTQRRETRATRTFATRSTATRPLAFTVTELLVVMTLIIILVLIAVPSFSAMVYSSEEALAQSQLRSALRAARDVAIRSGGNNDGAAVFLFEPGGRLTILPCVKVGEINDWKEPPATNNLVRREIFAAAPGFAPITLPKYWMVRGFAAANSMTKSWYGASETSYVNKDAHSWLFPETGFFNVDSIDDGMNRSTFMVRFQAGTGVLVGATTEPALVLAPRASSFGRTGQVFDNPRADREEDPGRFVRTILNRAVSTSSSATSMTMDDKRRVVGRQSSDMVLAKPVMQLTLYNETKLAAAFGVRLDTFTNSIYTGPQLDSAGLPVYSGYAAAYVPNGSHALTMTLINQYLEGDTNLDGVTGSSTTGDAPEAMLFTVDRYTGALRKMEVQP